MRNLRGIRHDKWDHPDVTATCWDPAKDEILCTIGPTEQTATIELVRLSDKPPINSQTVASWDAPSPNPEVLTDTIVSLHHFSDTSTTCVILAGGDIVTIQEPSFEGSGDAHIEIVGSIDAGISAARWSPDDELLALTTREGNAVFMGRSFDPIADVPMTSEDLKASKHVSVGWGKKETQFQGRGAKAMRDPTIPERVDEGVLSTSDDGSATVTWRGDGAYVAINTVEAGARRVIRVYSREGVLDSVSEPVDGLEGALSWRPTGNLIAGIQRLQERVDVAFFERNGLRHGQFTLRSPAGPVTSQTRIRLEWNSDSTVLAVILDDAVQLWTMGNYHWYLKQEIPFHSAFSSLAWHPEKALRFSLATADDVASAEHVFTVSRGVLSPPNDFGAVAVIDGQTLKMTPFRTANVPPPMSMFDLELPSSIVDVAFNGLNTLMAVLHRHGVDIYQWQTKGERSVRSTLLTSIKFSDSKTASQVCFTSDESICVLTLEAWGTLDFHNVQSGEVISTVEISSADTPTPVSSISSPSGLSDNHAHAQSRSGNIYTISAAEALNPIGRVLSPPLPWCEYTSINDETVAVGMSRNGHLYANSMLLAKNCTSFLMTPDHIVFTTANHFVKFIHLLSPDEMEVPEDDPEVDERCRSVERGSKLVTAVPTMMSLVLQMPRGNLETIYPRAMVIAGIRKLIDEKNYGRAFTYCRSQRVDMNILYDHRPEQFISNVGLFLEQLKDVSYIDLFLSSLREEDVSQTMYKDTKKSTSQFSNVAPEAAATVPEESLKSKVNKICDAVLAQLAGKKSTNLQNIISAHVCKVPPALEDGLTLVAELMQEDDKLAETAVEHICFLVDVNRLYDTALGLYNLELALLVAQQSQRDPREYLPFIQNLHQLPDLRRKFEIDDHLDRQAKALNHLKAMDAFEELEKYTVKHSLYQDALGLYRYDIPRHRALTNLYAEHLEANSKYRDAGLAYEHLQNYAKAMSCYRAVGASSWRECLFAATQQQPPLSTEALEQLASVLADALTEAKDHSSAATIHLDYLSSIPDAVRSLCKGAQFAEAMRIIAFRSQSELLTSVFDPALVDALSSTTELLADCKAQLKAQVPRIMDLRRRAEEDPLAFYEGERVGGGEDLPDDVSIAASSRISTSASLFTRYTGKAGSVGTVGTGVSRATSKNRRREEKKRARGRKGTVYEEEYLVNSVRRLVERIESVKGEVAALVFALVRRDMGERARAVEALMAEVTEGCRVAVAEVFPSGGAANPEGQGEGEATEMPGFGQGGQGVFIEHMAARGKKQEPPVLTAFEKLALLGS
ncbi:elongator complex protein [Plectosphaerella plurivora]|uniref:Elongator complex protein 1 n=1 Tax=Plectosphaerella plurivora TaxID=936078 RepID=A0A9P8VDT3_9PEZI|nr:elongator complex protein [Plectosphaerella plurivora]